MQSKLIKFGLIFLVILILLVFLSFLIEKTSPVNKTINYGVSFSPTYAKYLKLDWQKTYIQMLDELKIKSLRLPSYWDKIEKEPGKYDFSETDFMLEEAEKRGARVLLVVGARQPRWPECHYPKWAEKLTVEQRQEKTLKLVQAVVEKYKNLSSVWAYQIENEPFAWWFGEGCDAPNSAFLQKQVDLVKSLDSGAQILITDSGEWGFWADAIAHSDILGVSVYRKAFNSNLQTYMTYPIPASYYQLKASIVTKLPNNKNKKVIVTELQAEPWFANKTSKLEGFEEQIKLFSLTDFQNNVRFVKKVGFEEAYLWGVEWWYFMAKNGYFQYLDYAKTIFSK